MSKIETFWTDKCVKVYSNHWQVNEKPFLIKVNMHKSNRESHIHRTQSLQKYRPKVNLTEYVKHV